MRTLALRFTLVFATLLPLLAGCGPKEGEELEPGPPASQQGTAQGRLQGDSGAAADQSGSAKSTQTDQ